MTVHNSLAPRSAYREMLKVAISDVDGVLLASPHECAWWEALTDFADPALCTKALLQRVVVGKPRLSGARAALEELGVKDAERQAVLYADRKQKRLEALVEEDSVETLRDAFNFGYDLFGPRWPLAAASSSKNINGMMVLITLASGQNLLDLFAVSVCRRDLPRGKPDPAILLLALAELHIALVCCFVIKDAPAGVQAARTGNMPALGVPRHGHVALLRATQADLVVTTLDEVAVGALANGRHYRGSV